MYEQGLLNSEENDTTVSRRTNFGPWKRQNYDDQLASLYAKDQNPSVVSTPAKCGEIRYVSKSVETDLPIGSLRSIQQPRQRPSQHPHKSMHSTSIHPRIDTLRSRMTSTIVVPGEKSSSIEFKLVSLNSKVAKPIGFDVSHFPQTLVLPSLRKGFQEDKRDFQNSLERMVMRRHESKNGSSITVQNQMITQLLSKLSTMSERQRTHLLIKQKMRRQ